MQEIFSAIEDAIQYQHSWCDSDSVNSYIEFQKILENQCIATGFVKPNDKELDSLELNTLHAGRLCERAISCLYDLDVKSALDIIESIKDTQSTALKILGKCRT